MLFLLGRVAERSALMPELPLPLLTLLTAQHVNVGMAGSSFQRGTFLIGVLGGSAVGL
ncbi:hypothetical protein [Azohydromonas australica]|uniref:hypothetical protein n=1 Tax=Azohydromonas australica TaxID=364039 RepID=UPI0003FA4815|nr:hypothetical protein [Azohydromonas australica]